MKEVRKEGYLLLVLLPILGISCAHSNKERNKTRGYGLDSKVNFQLVLNDYRDRHKKNPDKYWLIGNEKPDMFAHKVKKWKERVRKLMTSSKDASRLSRLIYSEFSNFEVRRFNVGTESEPISFCEEINYEKESYNSCLPSVCVIPKEDYLLYKNQTNPSFCCYPEFDSVVVSGIEMPNAFLSAIMYSRFWESISQKQPLCHETHICGCNPYNIALEKVRLYELKHDILDSMVGGKLSRLYEVIYERAGSNSNPYTAFAYVTKTDLRVFDLIFETEKQGKSLSNFSAEQFFVGLGLNYINKHMTHSEQSDEKVIFYEWFEAIFLGLFERG
jgi:hypothetical protein